MRSPLGIKESEVCILQKRAEKTRVVNLPKGQISKATYGSYIEVVLSIMDTEAWFLADPNLSSRIDRKLSLNSIKGRLNYDLSQANPESYPNRTTVIKKILSLVRIRYRKKEGQVKRICSDIDYVFVCFEETKQKIPSFWYFLDHFNKAVSAHGREVV